MNKKQMTVLKRMVKNGDRLARMQGAAGIYEESGRFYLNVGYALFALDEDISEFNHINPLSVTKGDTRQWLISQCDKPEASESLPSLQHLKQLIELAKQNNKERARNNEDEKPIIWMLSDGTCLNALYLYDLMSMWPITLYPHCDGNKINPLVFYTSQDTTEPSGVILPVAIKARAISRCIVLNDYYSICE